jgi:hypothetical protein
LSSNSRMLSTGIGRGVEFDQVDEAAGVDLDAGAHLPQGVAVTPVSQLSALARMRASVVLPTPRVPVNR